MTQEIINSESQLDESAPAEKMLPQSVVNKIVSHAKFEADQRATERTRQEMMNAQAEVPAQYALQQPKSGLGNMGADEVRRIAEEAAEAASHRQQNAFIQQIYEESARKENEQIAHEFFGKLNAGASKYNDFDAVVGKLPLAKIAKIVKMANKAENTADIMYDLATNPLKLANMKGLADLDMDADVEEQIHKLSRSIKENAQLRNSELSNAPLSQIKTSPNSADSGFKGVSDFRKDPRLRG